MATIVDKKLLYEGFIYLRSRVRGRKTYWDCNRLRCGECCARAVTTLQGEEVLVLKVSSREGNDYPHSHPPNQEERKFSFQNYLD